MNDLNGRSVLVKQLGNGSIGDIKERPAAVGGAYGYLFIFIMLQFTWLDQRAEKTGIRWYHLYSKTIFSLSAGDLIP